MDLMCSEAGLVLFVPKCREPTGALVAGVHAASLPTFDVLRSHMRRGGSRTADGWWLLLITVLGWLLVSYGSHHVFGG